MRNYYSLYGEADAEGAGCTLNGASKSVRAVITGDLMFYSTILGKEHMSGLWCPYCAFRTPTGKTLGIQRVKRGQSIDGQKNNLHRIESGQLNQKIPKELKGVTAALIFNSIPLENWICPVLHMCIGIGNGVH